nr:2a75: L-lysine [uncultured bacterium]
MEQFGSTAGHRSTFGELALAAFLLVQLCDGVLTYAGVSAYGVHMEGNPLLAWLMVWMGRGPALAMTKAAASGFGIALHLTAVHRIVAALTLFYLALAILPWLGILYGGCAGC